MAKNELLPFANGEDANVLPTQQWEALTDILENGFQSGIARSEQVNRVLSQGAVASYVLGQLIVDQLNKDATLDKSALYQNLILALQENAKDACLPLGGGNVTGNLTVQGKNVVRSVNGVSADSVGNANVTTSITPDYESGVALSAPTTSFQTYTAPSDGYIVYDLLGFNSAKAQIIINGVTLVNNASPTNSAYWNLNGALLVAKGDVIRYKTGSTSANTPTYMSFYPLKGAN